MESETVNLDLESPSVTGSPTEEGAALADPSEVAKSLSRVDQDLQVALSAFRSAGRLRLRDMLRFGADTDEILDEAQVGCGIEALFRARELAAQVHERVHTLDSAHPARRRLGAPVRSLEGEFHSLFVTMGERPDPVSVVRHIKRVRRSIPNRLVRKLTV